MQSRLIVIYRDCAVTDSSSLCRRRQTIVIAVQPNFARGEQNAHQVGAWSARVMHEVRLELCNNRFNLEPSNQS